MPEHQRGVRDGQPGADVTDTIDLGIASLREHREYITGLGRDDFDPGEFLRQIAGYVGLGAGCDYAVGMRRYPTG